MLSQSKSSRPVLSEQTVKIAFPPRAGLTRRLITLLRTAIALAKTSLPDHGNVQ